MAFYSSFLPITKIKLNAYLRKLLSCFSKEQSDKWSLPAQRTELTTLAEKNNWRVLKRIHRDCKGLRFKDIYYLHALVVCFNYLYYTRGSLQLMYLNRKNEQ